MISLESVFEKNPEVVGRKVDNEYILVPLNDNIADMDSIYTLNDVGAFIWENIDGKKTVEDIIATVENEFEVSNQTASSDVMAFFKDIQSFIK